MGNEEHHMEKDPNSNGRRTDSVTCPDNRTMGVPESMYREDVQGKATRLYALDLFRYMYEHYYYNELTTINTANETRF